VVEGDSTDVLCACFRKIAPFDPGTVHVFLANPGPRPLTVSGIAVNGYDVTNWPNDWVYWWAQRPPSGPPQGVLDVMVKLRRPTQKLVRVSLRLSDGRSISVILEPVPSALDISFVGFDEDYRRAYAYVHNAGTEPAALARVHLDLRDVTANCYVPEGSVAPGGKCAVIIRPPEGLTAGAYVTIRVEGEGGARAAAVVRAYRHFPIEAWGGDARHAFGFDATSAVVPFAGTPEGALSRDGAPAAVCRLFEDPACFDGDHKQPLGTSAREIVERSRALWVRDPLCPCYLEACCVYRAPQSYCVYSELADVVSVHDFQFTQYLNQPLSDAESVALAKQASEPRLLWARTEAFASDSYEVPRYPTPEEERLMVYSQIGEGAKGLLYYAAKPVRGHP
jgi:hypothetical protein